MGKVAVPVFDAELAAARFPLRSKLLTCTNVRFGWREVIGVAPVNDPAFQQTILVRMFSVLYHDPPKVSAKGLCHEHVHCDAK